MIEAILFDMGGTLDGDGLHWLDRFELLYTSAGLHLTLDTVRGAFDAAERRAAADNPDMAHMGFSEMIASHVAWQLEHLGRVDVGLRDHLVAGFVEPARACARANGTILSALADRGFRLGVVSNGCGNVEALCQEFGYAPYLSVVIDSRAVGVSKPDPAIFTLAAARLGVARSAVMMVGDSFDRDVRPAKSAGMHAAWLEGEVSRLCPEPSLVDLRLRRLADLPAALESFARDVA